MLLRRLVRTFTGLDPGGIDTVISMAGLADRPVFFIHSLEDDRIAPGQTRRLWTAAGAKDPLWLVPGVGHNECWLRHRREYEERVLRFFAHPLLGEGQGLPVGEL